MDIAEERGFDHYRDGINTKDQMESSVHTYPPYPCSIRAVAHSDCGSACDQSTEGHGAIRI